jgi:hypothetical protein
MSQFREYRKSGITLMRPYEPGEDLSGVSVSDEDEPQQGGMIARNPANPDDKWYVAKEYFEENYVPVDD